MFTCPKRCGNLSLTFPSPSFVGQGGGRGVTSREIRLREELEWETRRKTPGHAGVWARRGERYDLRGRLRGKDFHHGPFLALIFSSKYLEASFRHYGTRDRGKMREERESNWLEVLDFLKDKGNPIAGVWSWIVSSAVSSPAIVHMWRIQRCYGADIVDLVSFSFITFPLPVFTF